ncbi:MAG TPA: PDZ domain-containing protein [Kofleriaceae bacterium]|nr:PDZ domain-containing protein [Kofleriaceae bacterium]
MRKRTVVLGFALVAAVGGVTGIVAASPRASKPDPAPASLTPATNRGRLGFAGLTISPELRAFFGAPGDRGVLVQEVKPDRPAAQAGLAVGDVVLTVDGDAVQSSRDIIDAIADRKHGDTVAIEVERNKQRVTLKAKLLEDPAPAARHTSGQLDDGTTWERFDAGDLPTEMRQMMRGLGPDTGAIEQRLDRIEQRLDKLEKK